MIRSKYVIEADSFDNKHKIFYNILNRKGIKISNDICNSFDELLEFKELKDLLLKYNFVYEKKNLIEFNSTDQDDTLKLILLPHQNCNFRCVYCYEKFDKNKMLPSVEQNLTDFIELQLSSGKYNNLRISWFGGEPLLAIDVIERLSNRIINLCSKHNVNYVSDITTNGYNLTKKNIEILLNSKVASFQITIDGIKEIHDKQRVLINGEGTYTNIIENLIELSSYNDNFNVILRMNVGPENLNYVDDFILNMKREFGSDERFQLYFHNIGNWGGENYIDICSENKTLELLNRCLDHKMHCVSGMMKIKPNNNCYASNPNSFVIGSDGTVYKCTVALYEESNSIGRLTDGGKLEVDENKLKLWTMNDSNQGECVKCYFKPSCNGGACPLKRIRDNIKFCPDAKPQIEEYIRLIDRQGYSFIKIRKKEVF